jgi:hypothetical protein
MKNTKTINKVVHSTIERMGKPNLGSDVPWIKRIVDAADGGGDGCESDGEEAGGDAIENAMGELNSKLLDFVATLLNEIKETSGRTSVVKIAINHMLRVSGLRGRQRKMPVITSLHHFIEKECNELDLQAAFKSICYSSVASIRDNIKKRLFKSIEEELLSSFKNRPSRSKEQEDGEYTHEKGQLEKLFEEYWTISKREECFAIDIEVS